MIVSWVLQKPERKQNNFSRSSVVYFIDMMREQFFACPNCGGNVPAKASACPHCGSDERTGWSEGTYLDGIDLGDDFDYEEARSEEFSPAGRSGKKKLPYGRIIIALVLLALFFLALLRSLT